LLHDVMQLYRTSGYSDTHAFPQFLFLASDLDV
jgi:hypothetical protein